MSRWEDALHLVLGFTKVDEIDSRCWRAATPVAGVAWAIACEVLSLSADLRHFHGAPSAIAARRMLACRSRVLEWELDRCGAPRVLSFLGAKARDGVQHAIEFPLFTVSVPFFLAEFAPVPV
jgi:hypothetical protein